MCEELSYQLLTFRLPGTFLPTPLPHIRKKLKRIEKLKFYSAAPLSHYSYHFGICFVFDVFVTGVSCVCPKYIE